MLSVVVVFLSWPTMFFLASVLCIKNNIAKKLNKRNIQSKFYVQWPQSHPSPDTGIRTLCLVAVFGISWALSYCWWHYIWDKGYGGAGEEVEMWIGDKGSSRSTLLCPGVFLSSFLCSFEAWIWLHDYLLLALPVPTRLFNSVSFLEQNEVSCVFFFSLVFEEHRSPLMFWKSSYLLINKWRKRAV